ncbi:pyridoxal phosphate-dependent decarboxylase family protein [Nonomuraea pusilla]|uniref:L-2,4-diaminobutyrate decarboxylase n=1 Tax=Nonomuraea pusilla TaxID=46177 RepID=A0A1H7NYD8_9ACTN|nr:pyridoxal-dependent decarboxylase [Nonomuraea pusilla]SEL28329.1 L-2,4-diaminobutyrate decarboxylase [Nonomuraea pusilla]
MTLNVLIDQVLRAMSEGAAERGGPVPALPPARLAAHVREVLARSGGVLPEQGTGPGEAAAAVTRLLAYGAADPAHPACSAHLHCPPLPETVAAEVAVSALNQSLDSWDQGPAAVTLERETVAALAGLAGFRPDRASGTVTTGGSESNLMGLLLARDRAPEPGPGRRRRVFASAGAHFSVRRAAALLGLGDDAVRPVAVDAGHRMDPASLAAELAACAADGDVPVAVVATAGTTDTGAIDPLGDVAAVAAAHGAWTHVDAAHGGGALFSARLAPLLRGLSEADSVSIDLHKFGWVPAPAGVFLVRDAAAFAPLETRAAYLNPDDDAEAGYDGLLGVSLRTTRRPDCVKILVALRSLGRAGLGELVERCHDLALRAADLVAAHPELELVASPVLSTVVFRYADTDEVNAALRRRLLLEGRAVVGRTELDGRVCLKLTVLNPSADVEALLQAVVDAGRKESR